MNLGGEPERDDSGLPPVDIEIPDDARELDRDVQAYRRELRALRRRQRRTRLLGPLTRDGVALPLLASCLVLVLIAGTLLTVFAAGPGGELPGATRPATTARTSNRPPPSLPPSPTATPAPALPRQAVEIGGQQRSLRSLTPVVLALVQARCNCAAAVRQLVRQASDAGVPLYLVGAEGQLAAVQELAAQAGHPRVAEDFTGALYATYRHAGLTAVLARQAGSVRVAERLTPGFRLTTQISGLHGTAPGASAPAPETTDPAPAGTPAATPRATQTQAATGTPAARGTPAATAASS